MQRTIGFVSNETKPKLTNLKFEANTNRFLQEIQVFVYAILFLNM